MILFTIGYEKLDQKQFIAYLSNHGVEVVAYIRKLPVSRKKGFSKTALRETLNCKGIDYIKLQFPFEISKANRIQPNKSFAISQHAGRTYGFRILAANLRIGLHDN